MSISNLAFMGGAPLPGVQGCTPPCVLNYNPKPKTDWKNISDADAAEIMLHPKVQKAMAEAVGMMQEKIKKDLCKETAAMMNDRLEKEEEFMSVANILSIVKALEAEEDARKAPRYRFRYQKKDADGNFTDTELEPKAWRKNHFSIPEIVQIILTRQGDALKSIGKDVRKAYEDFENRYNEPMEFDSYRLNKELDLVDYDFVEDDSPFKYMTGWEIAEEMFQITNNADRYLITSTLLAELLSLPQFKGKSNVVKMIKDRALKRQASLQTWADIENQDRFLRSKGVALDIAWKNDLKKFLKYQALSPSANAFRDEQEAITDDKN